MMRCLGSSLHSPKGALPCLQRERSRAAQVLWAVGGRAWGHCHVLPCPVVLYCTVLHLQVPQKGCQAAGQPTVQQQRRQQRRAVLAARRLGCGCGHVGVGVEEEGRAPLHRGPVAVQGGGWEGGLRRAVHCVCIAAPSIEAVQLCLACPSSRVATQAAAYISMHVQAVPPPPTRFLQLQHGSIARPYAAWQHRVGGCRRMLPLTHPHGPSSAAAAGRRPGSSSEPPSRRPCLLQQPAPRRPQHHPP